MAIINIIDALPVHPTKDYPTRDISKIRSIIIHHSAAAPRADKNTVRQLEGFANYHVERHGWPGIAYTYAIDPSGQTYKCNPISRKTYHAKGGNQTGIGIMLIGNFEFSHPTKAQLAELTRLVRAIRFWMPKVNKVLGHRSVAGSITACPGKNLTDEILAGVAV